MHKVSNIITKGSNYLKPYIKTNNLDARILLSHAINKTEDFLITNPDYKVDKVDYYWHLIKRRSNYEPIAYITGIKEFYGRRFNVNKEVLIPRSDSESIIDALLLTYQGLDNLKILDLGCGSGCLIVTLAKELKNIMGIGVDISVGALKVAKLNALLHNVDNKINFIKSDWFNSIPDIKFDIIISNPPYIPFNERHLMSKETLQYEPSISLFAENNIAYKEIILHANRYLVKHGSLFVEIGVDSKDRIKKIILENKMILYKVYKDLSGIDRVLEIKQHHY